MSLLTHTGQFNASAVTGNQAVTGVGFQPRALIFWAVGATNNDEFNASAFAQGIGFTTGPSNSYAQSSIAATTASTATYRRVESVAILQTDATTTMVLRRADLVSLDSDGFTVNWTGAISSGSYGIIHYLALGGSDLTGARAVNWQMPGAAGLTAVTGVGFQPDAVIHAHAGGVTTLNANATVGAALGIGVMTANGDQWAAGYAGNSTSTNARNQETNQALTLITTGGAIFSQAAFMSMDSDGFSLNFSIAGGVYQVISLCLKGGTYKAGQFAKSVAAAPVAQAITGTGFTPKAVLLAGVEDIVRTGALTGAMAFGLGVTDGTSEFATSLYGAATATRTNNDDSAKVYTKDNGAKVVAAEAGMSSLDSDGFTLGWTANDAVATSILYLAFGGSAVAAALDGAINGTSIATVTQISEAMPLAASVAATSTAFATRLSESQPLTATIAGVSTSAASNLAEAQPLAGSVTGTSTSAVTRLAAAQPLSASVSASSTAMATSIALGNPLAGISAGSSAAAVAGLSEAHPLATTVAGTAVASASRIVETQPLAATVAGASTATTSLAPFTHALTAQSAGTSAATGSRLVEMQALAASVVGTSLASGTGIIESQPLSGAATGTSDATASVAGAPSTHALTATVAGASSATATRIAISQPLAGTAAATSTTTAIGIREDLPLSGSAAATSTVTGTGLFEAHPLTGEVLGTSAATVAGIRLSHALDGMTAGASTASAASLSLSPSLTGTVASTSDVFGALYAEIVRQRLGLVRRIQLPTPVALSRTIQPVPVALSRQVVPVPVALSRTTQPVPLALNRIRESEV